MLFVQMALNDLINLYQKKSKHAIWDKALSNVRMLQAAVADCLKETVSEAAYKRTMNLMNSSYTYVDNYAIQYLDILNLKLIEMDSEKRKKNITIMAKRLAEKGQEYQDVKSEVCNAAKEYNCHPSDIRFKEDYPEEIDW